MKKIAFVGILHIWYMCRGVKINKYTLISKLTSYWAFKIYYIIFSYIDIIVPNYYVIVAYIQIFLNYMLTCRTHIVCFLFYILTYRKFFFLYAFFPICFLIVVIEYALFLICLHLMTYLGIQTAQKEVKFNKSKNIDSITTRFTHKYTEKYWLLIEVRLCSELRPLSPSVS